MAQVRVAPSNRILLGPRHAPLADSAEFSRRILWGWVSPLAPWLILNITWFVLTMKKMAFICYQIRGIEHYENRVLKDNL